jgi:hypothetical protein
MANRGYRGNRKVQEKVLQMSSRLKGESYEERCNTKGEAHVFKIVKGFDKLDPERIFPVRRQY